MLRHMCIAKIHRATVTEANLAYEGSLTVDRSLLDAAGILPYEQVHIVNCNNGARLETYTIPGEAGSGIVCLNGAAARLGQAGDIIIVIAYAMLETAEAEGHEPRVVRVDARNRIVAVASRPAAAELN